MVEGIVDFSDWSKIDLRVAEIKNVEEIEDADKLYKLTLDAGPEVGDRIVCAGIKPYYRKDDLIGRKIILFLNLTPRKLKGIESQGMILAAVNSDESSVVLLTPEKDIDIGSRIR
jgi:methionyl-tRNA synthetase